MRRFTEILEEATRLDHLANTLGVINDYTAEEMENILYVLVKADPTSVVKPFEREIKKVGKYSNWIVRTFLREIVSGHGDDPQRAHEETLKFMREDLSKTTEDLELFHRLKHRMSKKDINQITSFHQLFNIVAPVREEIEAEEEANLPDDQSEKLYEDDGWLLVVPKTQAASCKYGKGTRWCTAARNNNLFDHYNDSGPLFIVIDKHGGERKKKALAEWEERLDEAGAVGSRSRSDFEFGQYGKEVMDNIVRKYTNETGNIDDLEQQLFSIDNRHQIHWDGRVLLFTDSSDHQIKDPSFIVQKVFPRKLVNAMTTFAKGFKNLQNYEAFVRELLIA